MLCLDVILDSLKNEKKLKFKVKHCNGATGKPRRRYCEVQLNLMSQERFATVNKFKTTGLDYP